MPFDLDAHLDVEDFLECLEIEYRPSKGSVIRFPCPFHGGTHDSLAMNRERGGTFICHVCKAKGNAIHFASKFLGVTYLEANRMLKERYQPGFINPDARSTVEEVKKILRGKQDQDMTQPQLPDELLEKFAMDWDAAHAAWREGEGFPPCDYIFDRGFSPLALDSWEFGYDERTQRITFAVRDQRGTLIGFKGRSTDGREPKYLVMGDSDRMRYGWPRYYTGRVVYGAHRVSSSEVIVCEGELNAVAIWDKTRMDAVAINGSQFTDYHARIIRDIAEKAIVFVDSDDSGRDVTWGWTDNYGDFHPGIVDKLRPFMPVFIAPEHEGDPASMSDIEISEIVASALPWSLLRSQSVA